MDKTRGDAHPSSSSQNLIGSTRGFTANDAETTIWGIPCCSYSAQYGCFTVARAYGSRVIFYVLITTVDDDETAHAAAIRDALRNFKAISNKT